jgi:hypothetical protein
MEIDQHELLKDNALKSTKPYSELSGRMTATHFIDYKA